MELGAEALKPVIATIVARSAEDLSILWRMMLFFGLRL